MGSESTSRFEVRNSKSQKRTKKKDKLKGPSKNDTDVQNENSKISKKQTKRKRKSNSTHKFNAAIEKVKNNKEESNSVKMQKIEDAEESSDEEASPRKFGRSDAHIGTNQEDTQEVNNKNSKNSKEPSKRQLKREKAERRENEKREASKLEAMKKALNYVSKWKHARSEWKFEKLRQIWLIDNLLDDTSIPNDIFPTVLEYFEGCKGMAREQLLKKGMDVIKNAEDDEENRDEILESIAYKRARELMQALPTET